MQWFSNIWSLEFYEVFWENKRRDGHELDPKMLQVFFKCYMFLLSWNKSLTRLFEDHWTPNKQKSRSIISLTASFTFIQLVVFLSAFLPLHAPCPVCNGPFEINTGNTELSPAISSAQRAPLEVRLMNSKLNSNLSWSACTYKTARLLILTPPKPNRWWRRFWRSEVLQSFVGPKPRQLVIASVELEISRN